MELIYLHQYFVFPTGTGGTRSYDLATSFLKKGINVEIITSSSFLDGSNELSKGWNIIEREGLKLHVLKLDYSNELSYFKRILVFFQFLWYASFKLLSLKTDLVLATSTPLTIGIPALIKKWMHKTPFVFEARDIWPEAVIAIGAIKNKTVQKLLYWLEKIIYKNAAAIVPLSSDMKASITSRYPDLLSKPIEAIENISEVNRFQEGFDKNKSFLQEKIGFIPQFSILYAGTFGKVNGIPYVIELAEKLLKQNSSITFILIGGGVEKNNIIKQAKELEVLSKNVFVLDPVPKEKLPQIYSEVNMGSSFVIPIKELWANSANKFFDTLAAGKPILINHGGWQKRTIEKENIGYVLPSVLLNEKAVRDFIEYAQNATLIKIQEANALKLAKEKYSLEAAVRKYLSVFSKIGFSPQKNENEAKEFCV